MEAHVAVKLVRKGARLPRYATQGAAGIDLHACVDGHLEIQPGSGALIPTGIAMAIPRGFVGLVRDRSSLAVAGLHTVAGVIDSDYRGEIMVAAHNAGSADVVIQHGDRVAQMLILPCPQVEVVEAEELPPTGRGAGGFGSTGR